MSLKLNFDCFAIQLLWKCVNNIFYIAHFIHGAATSCIHAHTEAHVQGICIGTYIFHKQCILMDRNVEAI